MEHCYCQRAEDGEKLLRTLSAEKDADKLALAQEGRFYSEGLELLIQNMTNAFARANAMLDKAPMQYAAE